MENTNRNKSEDKKDPITELCPHCACAAHGLKRAKISKIPNLFIAAGY